MRSSIFSASAKGLAMAWSVAVPMAAGIGGELSYTTHWLGNSFGGGERWVQNFADDLAVAPDGTCYVASEWDESGREVGIYRGGDAIGACADLHGWGRSGGKAVALSDKYVFVASGQDGGFKHPEMNKNGLPAFPPKGTKWFGVRRFTLEGKPAPFPTGQGWGEHMAVLNTVEDEKATAEKIGGLCHHEGELYVSDPAHDRVVVLDAETMTEKRTFRAGKPSKIAAVGGTLYVVQKGTGVGAFTPSGDRTGQHFEEEGIVPLALAADPNGRLIVADGGVSQQILFVNVGGFPTVVRRLGEPEGLYSAPSPGKTGPFRLARPTGVGIGSDGTIYVAMNPPRGGCVLRAYPPDRKTPPKWELANLEFVDVADADPTSDGADVWSVDGRYRMDFSKPPGQSWKWEAQTINPFRYPDDFRLHSGHLQAGVAFRSWGGQKFLCIRGMWQHMLGIYRIDGNTAVPSALLASGPFTSREDVWKPPYQPDAGGWLWLDNDGDGQMTAGEYLPSPGPTGEFWASNVDTSGGIWQGARDGTIFHWPCAGVDKKGTPRYDPATLRKDHAPANLKDLLRTEYVTDGDVMYLTGITDNRPMAGREWGAVGTALFRFDGWSKADQRRERYRIDLPYEAGKKWIVSFCQAGDLLFFVDCKSAEVFVHSASDGQRLGSLKPGPEVFGQSGWVDFRDAIRAVRRKDGSYLVFVEEDAKGKTLVYHLQNPKSP